MSLFKNISNVVIASTLLASTACSSGGNDGGDEPNPGTGSSYIPGEAISITVLEYIPAPGQFINQIPEYTDGDTHETICKKATELLNNGDMISLGAWGGYITLKLNTPIANNEGVADFRINGNAVYAGTSAENEVRFGSSEPGIVLVMQDTNGNGIADDTWCELKGSETLNGIDNYTVTYHQPTTEATDEKYIYWESSNGDSGYLNRVSSYHTQNFFPMWLNDVTTMTFCGRRLPDNGRYNSNTQKFELVCYNGYADSHPNNSNMSNLDIDNAIDTYGNKVKLSSIDFIKIYTGVLQANGILGECSTEIAKIEKLKYN